MTREILPQVNVAGDAVSGCRMTGLFVSAYTCYNLTGGESWTRGRLDVRPK